MNELAKSLLLFQAAMVRGIDLLPKTNPLAVNKNNVSLPLGCHLMAMTVLWLSVPTCCLTVVILLALLFCRRGCALFPRPERCLKARWP